MQTKPTPTHETHSHIKEYDQWNMYWCSTYRHLQQAYSKQVQQCARVYDVSCTAHAVTTAKAGITEAQLGALPWSWTSLVNIWVVLTVTHMQTNERNETTHAHIRMYNLSLSLSHTQTHTHRPIHTHRHKYNICTQKLRIHIYMNTPTYQTNVSALFRPI